MSMFKGMAPVTLALTRIAAIGRAQWIGNARAGLPLNRGNTSTESFNLGLKLRRRGRFDRLRLTSEYLFARQNNFDTGKRQTTEDEWFAAFQYDYFLTPPRYVYG